MGGWRTALGIQILQPLTLHSSPALLHLTFQHSAHSMVCGSLVAERKMPSCVVISLLPGCSGGCCMCSTRSIYTLHSMMMCGIVCATTCVALFLAFP